MTNEAWGNGWLLLKSAFPQQVAEEVERVRGKLYREKLDDLSDAEWMAAVDRAIDAGDFFPTIKVLRKYGRPEHLAASGAAVAYAEILDRFERGDHPLLREIRENLGRGAAEAFMAAGGEASFMSADERNAVFRFDKFVKAYEAVVADDPKAALPQESIAEALGLPVGEALPLEKVLSPGLGQKFISRPDEKQKRPDATKAISDDPSPRLVPRVAPVPPKEETTKEMLARLKRLEENAKPIRSTDERLAELKAQADIIRGLPGPGPKVEP